MKKTSAPHPLYTEDEASEKGEAPNFATVLVNELLKLYIANRSERIPCLTLRQSQPLGAWSDDKNSELFLPLCNRLKVLADLNPVLYQDPVEAYMTVTLRNEETGELRNELLHLHFDDQCDDPFCRIELIQAVAAKET